MADYNPIELVYQTEGLSEPDRQNICGVNALSLLGLDPARFAR